MPNWCYNAATISHPDPAMLTKMEQAAASGKLFDAFVPMPEELRDTVSPSVSNAVLVEKYGHSDWYSWSVDNWGTKWDTEVQDITREGNDSVRMYFDTAWSPPISFYNKLLEQGFSVDATYTEEGMGFAGHYVDGDDNCVELAFDNDSSEWINEIEDEDLREIVQDQYDQWLEWQEQE